MLPFGWRIFHAVVPGRLFSAITHRASMPSGPGRVAASVQAPSGERPPCGPVPARVTGTGFPSGDTAGGCGALPAAAATSRRLYRVSTTPAVTATAKSMIAPTPAAPARTPGRPGLPPSGRILL